MMATVHPSRMRLVPQDPKDVYPDRRRARSPSRPHRYDSDHREGDKDRERTRDRESDDDSGRGRGGYRKKDWDRSNERRDRRRNRDGSRHRERERDEDRDRDKSRRASPEYGEYRRPASPGLAAPSMYPNRHPRDGMHERRSGYGGGSSEYLESRRSQRESSTFSIWPPSPKAARAMSPERGSSRRKSKRDRSETSSESTSDSESERRRRERKARKRARRERERRERKEHKHRSRSYDDSEEDHSRESHRDRSNQSKSRPRSPSTSPAPSLTEGDWVEKPVAVAPFVVVTSQNSSSMPPPATISSRSREQVEEDSDDGSDVEIGPQPLTKMTTSKKVDERAYGGALLRGEGSAMAAFLKDDTQTRIPRRGEIGLTSDEIALFEAVGYVMSGSRHKRMNAVRMRKENQVISAEEKRGILKLQREERERREAILREEFSELVQERLKGPDAKQMVT